MRSQCSTCQYSTSARAQVRVGVYICEARTYAYSTSTHNVRAHAVLATRTYVQVSVVLPLVGTVRAPTSTQCALTWIL